MNPLVSVIIPSYGGGQFLKRAIDSVLSQTYDNIEIIVVDDNGVGTFNQIETAKVMNEYTNDHKVKYVCHKVNINGSAARNTGVKESSGEYIALLDDDDEYLPEKIERQVHDILGLDSTYAIVFCDIARFRNGNKVSETHRTQSGYLFFELMMHKLVIGSSSLLIRKNIWNEMNGFDESFRRHQDWEFTARVAYKYKVKAEGFVGVKYNMEFRNSPKNPDITLAYRKHYLDKMKPFYSMLKVEQCKQIELSNLMDVVIAYTKKRQFKKAINLYRSLRPGLYGIKYVSNRLLLTIKKIFHVY